jgi:hypothetical protein
MNKKVKAVIMISLALLILALEIYLLVPIKSDYYEKLTKHAFDFVYIFVFALVFKTSKVLNSKTHEGKIWFFLVLGFIGLLVGDILQTILVYMHRNIFPAPAEIFRMVGYIGLFMAIFLKFLTVRQQITKKDVGNGVFVAACIISLVGYLFLVPIAVSEYSVLNKIISIFYPVMDSLIILFAVIIVSAFGPQKESLPWFFICIGLSLWTIADTMFAFFQWSQIYTLAFNLVNVISMAGLLAMGVGAEYQKLIAPKSTSS